MGSFNQVQMGMDDNGISFPALMIYFFLISDQKNLPQYIFILFWLSHYIHRTFIYPFTQSGRDKPYPFILVCMAFVFNCFNGFVNGYGVFHLLAFNIHGSYHGNLLQEYQFSSQGLLSTKSLMRNFG